MPQFAFGVLPSCGKCGTQGRHPLSSASRWYVSSQGSSHCRRLNSPLRVLASTRALGKQQRGTEVDWLRLADPLLWQGTEEDALEGEATSSLSPGFKVMLLSDGSVTRHLRLITGKDIRAECHEMRALPSDATGLPPAVDHLRRPLIQRQVTLRVVEEGLGAEAELGPPLVHAVSWWNARDAGVYLQHREQPIWTSLQRTELRRDIQAVYCGNSQPLQRLFGAEEPLWGRQYTFWKGGEPLTVIYEVFSPRLMDYLGTPNF